MHLTLHLTDRCNLACGYCYEGGGDCRALNGSDRKTGQMSADLAEKAIRLGVEETLRERSACSSCSHLDGVAPGRAGRLSRPAVGVIFFGGEPLLCKGVIREVIARCRRLETELGVRFYFKITTNGLLLDQEFLELTGREQVMVALSHDGTRTAHDRFRRHPDGSGSYGELEPVIERLLRVHPYAPVLMTVCPETAGEYARGVRELWERGFRYFVCSMNYGGDWDGAAVRELKRQYRLLAEFYLKMTRREEKFYFSPFDVKIASHIKGEGYRRERCELGRRQISAAPDGSLYPCTQFVGHEEYRIGTVEKGIDEEARLRLYLASEMDKEECGRCALKGRCSSWCGCVNFQVTGSVRRVAPMLCQHERIVIPIADRLAARLYRENSGLFIQKQYNQWYPVLSLIEDRAKGQRPQG